MRLEAREAMAVGAQQVGEQVGIPLVAFRARGGLITGPRGLDGIGMNRHDGMPRGDAVEADLVVGNGDRGDPGTLLIDDAKGMLVGAPVDAGAA